MKKYFLLIVLVLFGMNISGCTVLDGSVEVAKTIWGSSTRALDKAREDAIVKTYDKSYWDVVKAVEAVIAKKSYVIFKKDEIKGYLVIMGVKGAVNTTEVGILFVEEADNKTRVDVYSLSSHAKRLVAKNLYHGLDIAFGIVPPDPEPPAPDVSKKDEPKK